MGGVCGWCVVDVGVVWVECVECVGGVCGWCVVDVGVVCGCSVKCDSDSVLYKRCTHIA